MWKAAYRISVDGDPVAMFDTKWSGAGGWFTLDGHNYELRCNAWGSKCSLLAADGAVVATAEGIHRKHWTVRTGWASYQFRRDSVWKMDQSLVAGNQRVGAIKIVNAGKGNAAAELAGLPLLVQVFVLATVLIMWNSMFIPMLIIVLVALFGGA